MSAVLSAIINEHGGSYNFCHGPGGWYPLGQFIGPVLDDYPRPTDEQIEAMLEELAERDALESPETYHS